MVQNVDTPHGQSVDINISRRLPHSESMEKAVLASLLRDFENSFDVFARCHCSETSFYVLQHRVIYQAIAHFKDGKKIDLLMVAQHLRDIGKLESIGGEGFLLSIWDSISTTANIESWCETLRKFEQLRKAIEICRSGLVKCFDDDCDPADIVDEIEGKFFQVRQEEATKDIQCMSDLVDGQLNELLAIAEGKRTIGIKTGFTPVDNCVGGLKPGEMFVLAARPAMGKTSLALNVVQNITVCANPRPVAFFSLEMTAEQLTRRLICSMADVSETKFWRGDFLDSDMPRLTKAISDLRKAPIYIDATPGISLAELRAKARRLKKEKKIELIVIDYLQLMHADKSLESRQLEVATISGGIKQLAKDLNIPILILAQLNREVDKASGANARPKLANLRESGAIEQDADVVSFLHRDREQAKDAKDGTGTPAEWIIEKNRNGATTNARLVFYPARMLFMAAPPVSSEYDPAPTGKKQKS